MLDIAEVYGMRDGRWEEERGKGGGPSAMASASSVPLLSCNTGARKPLQILGNQVTISCIDGNCGLRSSLLFSSPRGRDVGLSSQGSALPCFAAMALRSRDSPASYKLLQVNNYPPDYEEVQIEGQVCAEGRRKRHRRMSDDRAAKSRQLAHSFSMGNVSVSPQPRVS